MTAEEKRERQNANLRAWRARNPDKVKISADRQAANRTKNWLKNRERLNAYRKEWRAKNPDKVKAQMARYTKQKRSERLRAGDAVKYATRVGKLIRPKMCSKCGMTGRIEGHHANGYSHDKKLDVIWLCVCCHKAEHRIHAGLPGSQ